MAKQLMITVKSAALRAFLNGHSSFRFMNITLTIQHAHDNEYQVLLPDKAEIIRLVDHGHGKVALFVV